VTPGSTDKRCHWRPRPAFVALLVVGTFLCLLRGMAPAQNPAAASPSRATSSVAADRKRPAQPRPAVDTPQDKPFPSTRGADAAQKDTGNAGDPGDDLDAKIARWKRVDWDTLARNDQVEFLQKLRQKCTETLIDFTATFHKQERIRGKLRGKEVSLMKFRAKPFSVYMKYTKGDKGREALYVDGKYDSKIQVHPGGLLGPLFQLKIEPDSGMAMKNNLRPITMAGMTNMLNTVVPQFELARANGDLTVSYLGKMDVGGRKAYAIKRLLPKKDIYPCKELVFFVDCEALVPIGADSYTWDNQLECTYRYTDFKLNTGLTDDDFDRRNKAYHF